MPSFTPFGGRSRSVVNVFRPRSVAMQLVAMKSSKSPASAPNCSGAIAHDPHYPLHPTAPRASVATPRQLLLLGNHLNGSNAGSRND